MLQIAKLNLQLAFLARDHPSISLPWTAVALARCDFPEQRLASAFSPAQRDADIPWHTARKIDNLIGDPIAAGLQIVGPELENLFWNAA